MHFNPNWFARANANIEIEFDGERIPYDIYLEAIREASYDERLKRDIEAIENKYIKDHAHRIMAERANEQ